MGKPWQITIFHGKTMEMTMVLWEYYGNSHARMGRTWQRTILKLLQITMLIELENLLFLLPWLQ